MRIPKRFKLFGKTIDVERVKFLSVQTDEDEDDLVQRGIAEYMDNKIRIAEYTKRDDKTFRLNDLEVTYWHEVVHWILYMLEYNELRNDEQFVTLLARCLHQVLITSEYEDKPAKTTA